MFSKISIIGCGLIGSSILRAVEEKKLASKISAYDKSKKVNDFLKNNFSSQRGILIFDQTFHSSVGLAHLLQQERKNYE